MSVHFRNSLTKVSLVVADKSSLLLTREYLDTGTYMKDCDDRTGTVLCVEANGVQIFKVCMRLAMSVEAPYNRQQNFKAAAIFEHAIKWSSSFFWWPLPNSRIKCGNATSVFFYFLDCLSST